MCMVILVLPFNTSWVSLWYIFQGDLHSRYQCDSLKTSITFHSTVVLKQVSSGNTGSLNDFRSSLRRQENIVNNNKIWKWSCSWDRRNGSSFKSLCSAILRPGVQIPASLWQIQHPCACPQSWLLKSRKTRDDGVDSLPTKWRYKP